VVLVSKFQPTILAGLLAALVHHQETFMTHTIRRLAVAAAALVVATGASAAKEYYEFKTFYDTSTWWTGADTATLGYSVASMSIEDYTALDGKTGVKLKLTLNDTDFNARPGSSLYIDELWLAGATKGKVAGSSGAAIDFKNSGYYSKGFYADGGKYNYDINFENNKAIEGNTTTLTILGNGISTQTFGSAGDLTGMKPISIEVANVGGKYRGLFGLNNVVHFIGTPVMIPEPSTYALMGLGLAGVAFVARKRKAA
jgi:PEP-CTERM motif